MKKDCVKNKIQKLYLSSLTKTLIASINICSPKKTFSVGLKLQLKSVFTAELIAESVGRRADILID